jgi:bleomycin hydrolase
MQACSSLVIQQYGTIPKAIYPESYSSSYSRALDELLQTKLREHAIILRELYASLKATHLAQEAILSTVRAKKEELMKEVYTIMTATLGVPPAANKKFVFDYCDKDGKPGRWEGTPIEFYKVRYPRQGLLSSLTMLELERRLWKIPSLGVILPHK